MKKKLITIMIAALLVCLMVTGCGKKDVQVEDPTQTQGPAPTEQLEVTVENEQELRELLAQDSTRVIRVSGEMEVREGFVVNGTKTLIGDANIKMALGAELGQSMLTVTKDSSLTVDGPVLDCNFNADGIYVAEKAELICLSGTIQYAGAYGILTYGDVTVEDIRIEDSEFISICAQTGSHVDVKGGTVLRSASNDVYVVNGASVNISGNTVMEGALEHGMINYGTLEIHGGKFGNVNNYLCDNYGELTVAYQGEAENGTVEFYGARNSIFLVRKGSTASISDVYIHDTDRQGIASLGGDTSISNCTFVNTGTHSIDIQGGKATVENVAITGSLGSGLEASSGAKVKVTNFTVNSCERIGIASRGAAINASNITISNTGAYGLTCGTTKTGTGTLSVTDAVITDPTNHGIYIYDSGWAELKNVAVADGEARGIYVAATASCKISGKSSFKNMAKGGVEVRGLLRMHDVEICNNDTQNSGAGVYVADGGDVIIYNGAIHHNSSALRGGGICVSNAKLEVEDCEIYGNTAVNHGGGLYAQNDAVVTLRTGSLYSNKSDYYGDGVYILNAGTNVTMSGAFYLGKNDVKVDNTEAFLTITRDGLSWHSASDPLLLTPNYNAPEGTVVATCKSAAVAKLVLAAAAPGDGSYALAQEGKNIVIKYAVADMDMTGADTVQVSSFEELKAAVEGTESKRNIVLTSDIVFSERIRFPGGVTINIQDDGTKRTMSRAEGFTDSFFVTHYGTGLYLTGTASNMLVLDGGRDVNAEAEKLQPLVRAAGSTRISGVVLQNNGSPLKEHDVRGALVRQIYGDIKIYDSTLSGGSAYAGGALMLDQGAGYIENCVFTGNESTIGGGAIRVSANCELEVVSSRIADNHAGSTGGGIIAVGASKVTATNTSFENNTAVSYGGALGAQDADTQIKLVGTDAAAVFQNNSAPTAGAVYAVKGVQVEITGYTFDGNKATDGRAGAVSILDGSSATITDTVFYSNKATASAGALSVDGSTAKLIGCEFGKEGAGNEAGDKAGAILVMQGSTVEMTAVEGKAGSVKYNTALGEYGGGAAYVDAGSTLKTENYLFEGNAAVSGGAVYIAENGTVLGQNNLFTKNQTTSKNGGAVYCAGMFTDTGSSYIENKSAKHGGAVIVMGTGAATMDGTSAKAQMKGNTAPNGNGGAVFVNQGGKASVTGYTLEGNTSKTSSIQVQVDAAAALKDITFTGDAGRDIHVNGSLTVHNLTGAHILQTNAGATFTVSGYQTGNSIEFTPKKYEAKIVLTKAEGMAEADFQAACDGIKVTPSTDGKNWFIANVDGAGKLISSAISTVNEGKTEYFDTLEAAVAYANGKDSAVELVILANTTVNETIEVKKNVTIVNAADKTVTISRGAKLTGDLFQVSGSLTLGSDAAGALIVDGASTNNIAGRTVTVNGDAAFTLAKNAVLQNAKASVPGAAIQTASAKTYVYGTIQNNVTSKAGAALDVLSGAKVQIDGAAFLSNRSAGVGGAIQIIGGAEVTSQNARFETNKALSGETYANGGAVYCAGIFTDTNSSYIGNAGKNGGAVIVMSGGKATLTGTDAAKAIMQNNTASANNGGAVFVNGGGTAVVTGYKLEGNTPGGIQVQKNASATLNSLTFADDGGKSVYVNGSLTVNNLTGVTLVQADAAATFTVSGYQAGNVIEFTPAAYEAKKVLNKAAEMADADFQAACKAISVTQKGDGSYWSIDETGKLTAAVASIATGDTTEYFHTLAEALIYADAHGGTGETAAIEIVIMKNVSVDATVAVNKNIAIVNASGAEVTISRGADLTADMFQVNSAASLTLGRTDGGKLIVDGASTNNIAGRTVTVNGDAAFTLAKNAVLQNAKASVPGAAIQTASAKTYVYGTIQNNVTSKAGAALDVLSGAKVQIDGAAFLSNRSAGVGGAIQIIGGAEVTSQNARFETNKALSGETYANGGAVYCAGIFTDTNSSYIGNAGKNGGAVIVMSGGKATLTGTDAAKAIMQNNTASANNGGAVFVNGGGTAMVTGYKLEGNTPGGIQVQKNASATLNSLTFADDAGKSVYVNGNLTFNNLTGVTLVQADAAATFTVSGYQAGNVIEFTPKAYEAKKVLNKAAEMADADFQAACKAISVTQKDDGSYWVIDKDGALASVVASITTNGEAEYYGTLNTAVAAANAVDAATEIVVLVDTAVSETLTIEKNVTIVNAPDQKVTISRGAGFAGDMFTLTGELTIGSGVTIDGAPDGDTGAAAVTGRTITVRTGAELTLEKDVVLKNAKTSVPGAAVDVESSARVNINGAKFINNQTNAVAGAIRINSGATVICQNAEFNGNKSWLGTTYSNGGAVYVAGTFNDNGSSYIGNEGKNGAAIFTAGGVTTVSNGTFTSNKANVNGAAVFVNGGEITLSESTFTGNTKLDGSAINTVHRAKGTLKYGANVSIDGVIQAVTAGA